MRGPRTFGGPPGLVVVRVRRYSCRACAAVVTVVPRGVRAQRHFAAGAIGLALHRYGGDRVAAVAVRDHVGGIGPPEATTWRTLGRWIAALAEGLFAPARAVAGIDDPRERAARAAMVLASFAPARSTRATLAADVFDGAVLVAAAA